MKCGSDARARVAAAWGDPPPDYIAVLADECDRTSQRAVAKRIGISLGAISTMLNRTYAGRADRVEAAIRQRLMAQNVPMPEKRSSHRAATSSAQITRANEAWGKVPAWVARLAEAVERDGYERIAARLGYSVKAVSAVIGRKYSGNLALLEAAVRGLLLGETCHCPVLEDINKLACVDNQRRPEKKAGADPVRRMLFEACRSCPNSLKKKGLRP